MSKNIEIQAWQRHSKATLIKRRLAWLAGIFVFAVCWMVISNATTWFFVLDSPRIAGDIFSRSMPPKWAYMNDLIKPLWDTINIATLGTGIAVLLGIPLAFLTARNTTPSAVFIRPLCMIFIAGSRSINALIWALLMVTIIGPGIFAGMIAIMIRSVGFFGKLLYEAIEEIDRTPVDAITATGASPIQVMVYAIWPQIKTTFVGVAVFRWDVNIRHSTVLGIVGAGGIGLELSGSLNTLAWPQVSLIIIVIFFTVMLSEYISAKVREAIMKK